MARRRPTRRPLRTAAHTEEGHVILREVIRDDLGCTSHLVGDEEARVAAVVDPKP